MAGVNVVGLVGIVVFYCIMLSVGLWAARRRKRNQEETMLAGRSIGIFVGTFSLTGNLKGLYYGDFHFLGSKLC